MLSKVKRRQIQHIWSRLHRHPLNIVGLYGTLFFILLAIYPDWLIAASNHSLTPVESLLPAAWSLGGDLPHLLGTDQYGYDIFTSLILGIRSSFGLSLLLTLLITTLSIMLSLWLSFQRGILSQIVLFILRCISLLPSLLMGIIIALIWGASLSHAAIAIGIVIFPVAVFRISQKLRLEKSKSYIFNAYLNGASHRYIIFKLLLPNSMQDIIEEFVALFTIILLEITVLAFFDLSGPLQLWEWGSLLREGSQLMQHSLLLILYPGLILILALLCIQLLGRSIIDVIKIEDE